MVDGKLYGFFSGALEVIDGPVFDKPADWAGAENVAASMAMPTRWEISAIGRMSASTVRAAQLGRIFMRLVAISRANASVCFAARGPAPGRPIFSESMPRDSIRWRISIFSSMVGSWTEGFCRPSRRFRHSAGLVCLEGSGVEAWFQS